MRTNRSSLVFAVLSVAVVTSACAFWMFPSAHASPAAPSTKANAPKDSNKQLETVDWKDDPVCQMVFFAVLEGLYADGVPSDVVNSLVPKSDKQENDSVKANFVAQCPLCHPVFEALSLYQRRGAFLDGDGRRNTFGKGIDKDLQKRLTSQSRMDRLTALRVLVRRWVERRMTMMRLSEEERTEWTTKLAVRSQQGRKRLFELMKNDPAYGSGWSAYWGCAACNGTTDACQILKSGAEEE